VSWQVEFKDLYHNLEHMHHFLRKRSLLLGLIVSIILHFRSSKFWQIPKKSMSLAPNTHYI